MAKKRIYTFIDLFAGCGGLSEGFMESGHFKSLAHIEWEYPMVQTLRHRLVQKWGETEEEAKKKVLLFDIQKTEELINGNWDEESMSLYYKYNSHDATLGLRHIIGKQNVDFIIGGPPCQAYSIHGRATDKDSMQNDYRNYLFESFVKVVDAFKPKAFIFENVTGMLSAKPGGIPVVNRIYDAFKKIGYINENRNKRIRTYISQFKNYEDFSLAINDTLANLSFGISAEKFEKALCETGSLLGFISQRPDKEIRKGPDNLWCGIDNQYFLFECKTEVDGNRPDIHKHEVGQMNNHCGWFENEYKEKPNVKYVMIIPTLFVAHDANFTHDVEIMRMGKLKSLKKNIANFVKEFKSYNLQELSDDVIQNAIAIHQLDIKNLLTDYSEKYKKREKK